MATEIYIVKLRILSLLRWFKELGVARIIIGFALAASSYKYLLNASATPSGIFGVIFLNISIITSVHLSRRDGFFLNLLGIRKELVFFIEYFIYSMPFLSLTMLSESFYSPLIIILFLFFIVNTKNGVTFDFKFFRVNFFLPVYAFEITSGIRKNLFLFFIIFAFGVILSYQPVAGIISVIIIALMFTSFYTHNEPMIMIEAYSTNPKNFILTKVFQNLKIFLVLILPIALLHWIFFFERWYLMAVIIFICSMIIISSVLTKYAFFSEEFSSAKMNYIITGIIIFSFGSSFFMTGPLLLPLPFLMIIYLYRKAVKNIVVMRYISF